jgi:hypothetical protein
MSAVALASMSAMFCSATPAMPEPTMLMNAVTRVFDRSTTRAL